MTLGPPWPHCAHRGADGDLVIGSVSVREIARDFGTPAYVIVEDEVRERAREFRDAFAARFAALGLPPATVAYAAKAMWSTQYARWIGQEGLDVDVCTGGELAIALRAGISAQRLTMHGNNKSIAEITQALNARVALVVLDSPAELSRVASAASRRGIVQDVGLRLTTGVHVETHAHIQTGHEDQKFGFSLASGAAREAVAAVLGEPRLRLTTLHCHLGSQVLDPELGGYDVAIERLMDFRAAIAAEHGVWIERLDLGGGFGIPYLPNDPDVAPATFAARLATLVREAWDRTGGPAPLVSVEPGRAIAGPSGITLYTVGTVKQVGGEASSTIPYVSVDGGMSDNIRPALYGAAYTAVLASRDSQADLRPARIVGKHCETGDLVVPDALLPDDVAPGDLIAVAATGAYGHVMASNYNATPRPPVIAVRDKVARPIVRRETLEDLVARDVMDGDV